MMQLVLDYVSSGEGGGASYWMMIKLFPMRRFFGGAGKGGQSATRHLPNKLGKKKQKIQVSTMYYADPSFIVFVAYTRALPLCLSRDSLAWYGVPVCVCAFEDEAVHEVKKLSSA